METEKAFEEVQWMSMVDPSIPDTAAYHIIEDDWLKETTVGLSTAVTFVFIGDIDQMCWNWKQWNIIRKYFTDVDYWHKKITRLKYERKIRKIGNVFLIKCEVSTHEAIKWTLSLPVRLLNTGCSFTFNCSSEKRLRVLNPQDVL